MTYERFMKCEILLIFFCCKVLTLMIYLFPWGDRALYPLLNLPKFIKFVLFVFKGET